MENLMWEGSGWIASFVSTLRKFFSKSIKRNSTKEV